MRRSKISVELINQKYATKTTGHDGTTTIVAASDDYHVCADAAKRAVSEFLADGVTRKYERVIVRNRIGKTTPWSWIRQ